MNAITLERWNQYAVSENVKRFRMFFSYAVVVAKL